MGKPIQGHCCVCGVEGEHDPESSLAWKDTSALMRTCADGQLICRQCDSQIKRESSFAKVEAGLKKLRKLELVA